MHLKTRVNVMLSADRTNKLLLLSLRKGPKFKVQIISPAAERRRRFIIVESKLEIYHCGRFNA